ncbi:MAG TPA: hypothetical protein DIU35_19895 [Candidatus Latescibacteria bacterium]|nr:hypothetical protein [Candidatus Latescibacterota bacterium]
MGKENTTELGNGYSHHGVATAVSNHRGTVATVDGDGRNVALVWLYDHRGGYAILMIDAETGDSEQFSRPFVTDEGFNDCPFASILSSRNKYYTHFSNHFVEFDPVARGFTFHHQSAPQMAMSMTEDDEGRIWAGTYPDSGVVSYDPGTGVFKDYGHLYAQNWRQYPRSIAADDTGWVYFGVGSTASQIISLDPESGEAVPLLAEEERTQAHAPVIRDLNGKVYGHTNGGSGDRWMELYQGKRQDVGVRPNPNDKPYIASGQGLFYSEFPDGKRLAKCDLVNRCVAVEDPETGEIIENNFKYTSEGAHIMGVAVAPDNTICGGTAFPMHFFSFNPSTDTWINRPALGQFNTVARGGDKFFIGAYTHGLLEEWDPSQPWVHTEREKDGCNPQLLFECHEVINRPHMLLAHPNGRTVVLAGTPGYGLTGGGLLFWDRQTLQHKLLKHTEILEDHSTMSLVPLLDGKLLGGTTVNAGTGGEQKAEVAELYMIDIDTKRVDWHSPVLPGVDGYADLCASPRSVIYGIADHKTFFVFDPYEREVVQTQDVAAEFGPTSSQQGPRVFVVDPNDKTVYVLFEKGVGRVGKDHRITLISESPVKIDLGGDILDNRIYFGSGSHLYSYGLSERQ